MTNKGRSSRRPVSMPCCVSRSEAGVVNLNMKTHGSTVHRSSLTENWGTPTPAGASALLYVGVDAGRRSHVVAAIPRQRMGDGSWERAGTRQIATTGAGYAQLTERLAGFGISAEQVSIGIEPTGGWYTRTVVRWLEKTGYTVTWLQNWAIHERRQLAAWPDPDG
jgi:hypothetical protein